MKAWLISWWRPREPREQTYAFKYFWMLARRKQ